MRKAMFGLMILLLSVTVAAPVAADVEINQLNETFDSFTVGGEVNVFYRYDKNP